MSDDTINYMLGFITAKQWVSAINEARHDKQSGISEKRIWELIQEQDTQYAGDMKAEVEELLRGK
jgi:hypothetical protein